MHTTWYIPGKGPLDMKTQQEQGAGGLGQGNPVECIAREQTATRMIVLTYRYSVYEVDPT